MSDNVCRTISSMFSFSFNFFFLRLMAKKSRSQERFVSCMEGEVDSEDSEADSEDILSTGGNWKLPKHDK